jgi:hypothetical protein
VFAWLKQHLARKAFQKSFERHYGAAEGSHIQRSVIAAAMSEIEYEMVQRQRAKQSPKDQIAFMITYECMVMWSLGKGMELELDQQALDSAILAIQAHFAKHAWYQDDAFRKIWQQMQRYMPMAMRPGPNGHPPFPVAEMAIAAQLAGYPYNVAMVCELSFGFHVASTILRLAEFARLAAKEHLKLNQTTSRTA